MRTLPWLDRWFPDEVIEDPDRLRRARLVLLATMVLLPNGPGFAILFAIGGAYLAAVACVLVSVAALGTFVLVRRPGGVEAAGHLVCTSLLVGLSAAMAQTGGPGAPGAAWLALLPIIALASIGRFGALLWLALAAATLGAFTTIDAVRPFDTMLSTSATRVLEVSANACLIGLVTAMCSFWYAESDQARAELVASNADLEAAREEAEAATRAKSQFLANMSHEIRTPLNAVIGFTQLILEDADELPEPTREDLSKIDAAAQHLLSLLNDILDLSRLEAGQLRPTLHPVRLDELVRSAVERCREDLGEGVRLVVDCPSDVLSTDSDKLSKILDKLVSNAVRFTEHGTITVRARKTDALRIEVVDTGVGLEPDQTERIFEKFTQGDDSSTRRYGGSGLGLTIARELARLLGGRIEVQSAPGVGSTFTLVLPV